MNILIVDDEYYIVQGILKNMNWKALGIKETYSAYSMNQALQILQEKDIHILLTDIEMPKGNGLELIEAVNNMNLKMIKLLLTGHENFGYAKKAIELGCYQYIVKPIHPENLESLLQDAIKKYKLDQATAKAQALAASWNTTQQLKYNRFWAEIIKGNLNSHESIDNAILRYGLDKEWSNKFFRFIIIHRYPAPNTLETFTWEIIERSARKDPGYTYILDTKNCLIVDIDEENSSDNMLKLLTRSHPNDYFTLFVSEPILLYDSTLFYTIVNDLIQRTFTISSLIVPIFISKDNNNVAPKIKQLNYEVWPRLIIENKSDHIQKEISTQYIRKSILYPLTDLKLIYQMILHAVMNALESVGNDSNTYSQRLNNFNEEDSVTTSLPYLLDWSERLFTEVAQTLHQEDEQAFFITTIKKHISDNLSSTSLSRNSIANEIHMNPDYISFLFHKLSGIHLSTYISNERIQEAKKLLLTTNLTLQEISTQTGFSNTSYFHKQFKKATGMTPQQFRKKD